ncbi:hypothetical protein [Brachybacterium alimentarium]|uniref:hypothetical protein n=1 Tax=Brachybacterium alimentarium TaxID=47845 RepID=UPI003FD1F2B5
MSASLDSTLTDKIFRAGDEIIRIVILSFLCTIMSLPIVTAPAAFTASFASLHHHFTEPRRGYVQPYFSVFRRSFGSVTVRGLLLMGAAVLFAVTGAYYLGVPDPGRVRIAGAVIQLLAGVGTLAVMIQFIDGASRYWLSHDVGDPPSLVAAARTALGSPWASLVAVAAVIAVPALMYWLALWQFVLLTVGIQIYAAVRILRRAAAGTRDADVGADSWPEP